MHETRSRKLSDGITTRGVGIGDVGYANLDDDCTETMAFVDFVVRVAETSG
jgi:hypothetical protein